MAAVGNFMATGTGFYIFNAFMKPLCGARGWTRTEVNVAPLIASVLGLVTPLIFGALIRKVGPRSLMVIGSILAGLSFIGLGQVKDVRLFYVFFVLLAIGNAGISGMVVNAAISNWFVQKRGRAMGLATAASSASGVFIPYLAMVLINAIELGNAFLGIGLLVIAVAPAAGLIVRNQPETYGLLPDGILAERPGTGNCEPPIAEALPRLWSFPKLFRCATAWKLGLAYGLVMMGVVGVMFQLAPRFTDLGFGKSSAMILMSATAAMGTAGKYFWGLLCDRIDCRKISFTIMVLCAVGLGFGLLLGAFSKSSLLLAFFILIFGFAMGGAMSTFPIMIADLFGRNSFAVAASYIYILLALQGLGYIIMGQSYDRTGSYNLAYAVFIALSLLAAGLVFSLRRPRLN